MKEEYPGELEEMRKSHSELVTLRAKLFLSVVNICHLNADGPATEEKRIWTHKWTQFTLADDHVFPEGQPKELKEAEEKLLNQYYRLIGEND